MRDRNDLAEMVGPVYDALSAAALLAVSVDALSSACAAGRLIGMQTSDNEWVFPAFQFSEHGVDSRLLPAISALRHVPRWSASAWFTLPNPDLDGHTPLAWICDGNPGSAVTQSAQHAAGEWAA